MQYSELEGTQKDHPVQSLALPRTLQQSQPVHPWEHCSNTPALAATGLGPFPGEPVSVA